MECSLCLHENEEGAKYCGDCGRGLNGQGYRTRDAMGVWSDRARACGECGATIPACYRFCAICGMVPAAGQRYRHTRLWIAAMVIGLAVLASMVAVLLPALPG